MPFVVDASIAPAAWFMPDKFDPTAELRSIC